MRRIATPFGDVQVRRNAATGAMIYWQGRYHQSESDGLGVSLAAYVHAIFGVLTQRPLSRVLLIGGAAGTLGTMLHDHGAQVTICDVNPHAFDIARQYFCLPDAVESVVADGVDFLRRTDRRFDAIVLDAYHGHRMPAAFMTTTFARLARRRLDGRCGRLIVNAYVADARSKLPETMAARLASAFPKVRLLDEPGGANRNCLVLAGAVAGLKRPNLIQAPACEAQRVLDELAAFRFRPIH